MLHDTAYDLQMREMAHENINMFVGACIDPPNICILTNYCSKGTLQVGTITMTSQER